MVYVDIEYKGKKPTEQYIKKHVDDVLDSLFHNSKVVYVKKNKDKKEFRVVITTDAEKKLVSWMFNNMRDFLPDNLVPNETGYISEKEVFGPKTVWIVTISNYDEPGEGLAVFAPVVCNSEKEVADFMNEDMRASFQNEGWTIEGNKAIPPNYNPDDPESEQPWILPHITEASIKNNKEWETPRAIQLWTKWKVTKWEI